MPGKADPKCPLCDKNAAREYRPFCSRGCQDRDLLNWLDGGYRIPGPAVPPEGVASEEEGG